MCPFVFVYGFRRKSRMQVYSNIIGSKIINLDKISGLNVIFKNQGGVRAVLTVWVVDYR